MQWPEWIDELKQRYLASESSVFVLEGDVVEGSWSYAGERVDCPTLLRRFLEPSREVIGVFNPDPSRGKDPMEIRRSRLEFPGIQDYGIFKRAVEARLILDGRSHRFRDDTVEAAMGLIWLGLTTPGPRQGWILRFAEEIVPLRRKNLPPFSDGAPPLAEWNADRVVRASDNVVLLLTTDASGLNADVVESAVRIAVPKSRAPDPVALQEVEQELAAASDFTQGSPADEDAAHAAAMAEIEAEIAAALESGEAQAAAEAMEAEAAPVVEAPPPIAAEAPMAAEAPPLPDVAPPVDGASLGALVNAAMRGAILRHPDGTWLDNMPGREALADVLHQVAPEKVGPLQFTVQGSRAVAEGHGAEWFDDWYRGDIAVDAACGMVLGELQIPPGGLTADNLPELSAPALRALARRVERLLARG